MRGRRRERLRVESRVHDTNLRSVGEQNRCQVGPTILFECPAQIPRSSLRSFSLWARHPAETSAERNVRSVRRNFAPWPAGGARVRKRRREGNARAAQGTARVESPYTIQTCDPSVEQNCCQVGPTILFECPAQIPRSSLRSFSLWARHPAETSAERNVRSVRRNFAPWPAGGARVRKRRREGNEWAAGVERRYTIQRTIRWLKNRGQVGPTILFECPAQIPRSSLRSFSLWASPCLYLAPTLSS